MIHSLMTKNLFSLLMKLNEFMSTHFHMRIDDTKININNNTEHNSIIADVCNEGPL